MQPFLWLVTQMCLLLLAAAVVFFTLGWRFRGSNAQAEANQLNQKVDAEAARLRGAHAERDAATTEVETLKTLRQKLQADLLEAADHHRNLEREMLRLHDELKATRGQTDTIARLTAEQERLQAELAAAQAEGGRQTAELATQASLVAEQMTGRKSAQDDLVKAQAESQQLAEQNTTLAQERETLLKQLADATAGNERAAERLARLEADLTQALTAEALLKAAQKDLVEVNAQLDQEKAKTQAARAELEALKEQLAEANTTSAARALEIEAARVESAGWAQQAARLQATLEDMQAQAAQVVRTPEPPAEAPPAKAKRPRAAPRKTATTPTTPKAHEGAAATLARLASTLQDQDLQYTSLVQERDGCLRRLAELEAAQAAARTVASAKKSLQRIEECLDDATQQRTRLQRQIASLRRMQELAPLDGSEDDLTRIKGIKSVLSARFHELGIHSFQQIAAWTDDDLATFGELLAFKDRARRDQWVEQARQLSVATA